MSSQRDAAAQMRAVAADIEDVVMRLDQREPWTSEDSETLWAGAQSLLDWANELHPEEEEPSAQVKPGLLPGDPDEEY